MLASHLGLSRRGLVLLTLFGLGTGSACSCESDPGTTELTPSIEADGATPDPAGTGQYLVEFGDVAVGKSETRTFTVRNGGTAPMAIPPLDVGGAFGSDFGDEQKTVEVNQTVAITFTFSPVEAGAAETVVSIASDGGSLTVRLAGNGVVPAFSCTPDELDFGNVVKTTSRSLTVSCTNESSLDGVLVLSQVQGDDAQFFSYSVAGEEGRVLVGAGRTLEVPVTFRANGSGEAFAFFTIGTEDGGFNVNLTLRANVIDSALERDPDVTCGPGLDFGFVAPGTSVSRPMTLRNLGNEPLTITDLSMDPTSDAEFSVAPAAPFQIPVDDPATEARENEVVATFTFSPTDLGRRQGTVNLGSSDPNSPRIQICVGGFGGGPTLSCSPASIDFGQVAVGVPVQRSYVCTNAGTDDPSTTDDNLVIESVAATSGEFQAAIRGGAVEAGYAVGETFTVDVTYNPVDEGQDSGAIVLRNNDTANAEHQTLVSGNGRDLPPCQYEIRPPTLRFGIVNRNNSATLEFGIANLLDTECLVTDLRLSDDADPAFTLANGPIAGASIAGFGELRVPVTFAPPEYGTYDGKVQLYISDPADPFQEVDLRGASQEPCALIAPDDLDFGTVQPGCSTRDRELQIINICDSAITITAIELNEGASDEFFVRTRPSFPAVIPPGLSATFTMSYRPSDEGVDLGSVFITEDNTPEPYMATLQGRGANDATQTDVFSQDDRPQVDVLWVIDNSGSLSDEQAAVAANSAAFLQFALAQQIDFQIGVTTTAVTQGFGCPGGADGNESGRLFPVDGTHPRILTNATADLEEHWAFNTQVGLCHGDEQGLEAAYMALSPPVIDNVDDPRFPQPNDGNAGFLRRDAHLSLIFVSDEEDQSPQSTNFYYNFFLSLKGFRNANLFSAHAIVGDPVTGCATAGAGDRYIDVATRSGGIFQSVCAADWSESMETIGTAAFGFKTRFFLTNQPEDTNQNGLVSDTEGELEVRLDGRVYPAVGPRGDRRWEYVGDVNAIDFYPLAVPEPGSTVEVSYRVACL